MPLKSRITSVVLSALASVAVLLGLAAPAQAYESAAVVAVHVRADLSQSNMLVSFEDEATLTVTQDYVCEGCTWGEGTNRYVFSEPQRMWVNAGWCSGDRTIIRDLNTNQILTTSPWRYLSTKYTNGLSVRLNHGGYSNPSNRVTFEIYMVPDGVAGCDAL